MLTKDILKSSLQQKYEKTKLTTEKLKLKELLKIDFHDRLVHSLNMADNGDSFFLTGKPGTGKSIFLRLYKSLIGPKKKYAILAPTGVAAINVDGQTIHSFFKFDFGLQGNESAFGMDDDTLRVLRGLDTILIDEISMVRADILDGISYCLRYARNSAVPFGGVQMIFVGDLSQIPPVIKPEMLDALSYKNYIGGKCFHSKEYIKLKPERIIFDKVYRQDDSAFLDILDRMRMGKVSENDLSLLNKKGTFPKEKDFVHLCTTKKSAEKKNLEALSLLKGEIYSSEATISGSFSESSFPTNSVLKFRKGARVILLVNNYEEDSFFVNGDLGYLEDIIVDDYGRPECLKVLLDRTLDIVHVCKHEWENTEYSLEEKKDEKGNVTDKELIRKVIGTFEQFPIALGWALTIHKSQGKTLDKVVIDFGRGAFAFGQAYVAVSRCTSLENLYFHRPITKRDILVDKEVVDYLNGKASVDLEKDSDILKELFKKVLDCFEEVEKENSGKIFTDPSIKTDIAFRLSEELLKSLKFDALIK